MKRLTANSKSTFGIGLPEKLIEANFKGHASYLEAGRNLRPQTGDTCQEPMRLFLSSESNPSSC
jgi:hypothetical protein